MNKIFAITCHRLTNPLIHTVRYLSSFKENTLLIHLDLKSSIEDFLFLESDNVIFIPNRVDLVWGGVTQIQASINLMSYAKKYNFEYFFLLSGDDVPLTNNLVMNSFLEENKGLEFIHYQNYKNNYVIPDERLKYRYFDFHHTRNKNFIEKVLIKLHWSLRIFFKNKSYTTNTKLFPDLYKGVNWLGLTHKTLLYMLSYIDKNKFYFESYKKSLCADEVFFHSIINTSKDVVFYFDNNNINNALRFIDWNSGPEFPKVFHENDLLKIKKSTRGRVFFARKVAPDISCDFLEKLIDDK